MQRVQCGKRICGAFVGRNMVVRFAHIGILQFKEIVCQYVLLCVAGVLERWTSATHYLNLLEIRSALHMFLVGTISWPLSVLRQASSACKQEMQLMMTWSAGFPW